MGAGAVVDGVVGFRSTSFASARVLEVGICDEMGCV